jgi:hypothetical protein
LSIPPCASGSNSRTPAGTFNPSGSLSIQNPLRKQ